MDEDLPPMQTGPAAWLGPEMAARREWVETLSPAEVAEVEAAARQLNDRQADITTLTPQDFPLPTLGPRLARIRHDVLRGRGFALLRGLPVARWPLPLSATALVGIGSHFGNAVSQNAQGHVRDMGLRSDDPNVRVYQTAERQTFHTDSCDIVGLLCLQTARSGGDSALVSSSTLWNQLRQRRPDLARLLLQPIATDRRGEVPAGEQPFFTIPVFNWFAEALSAIYQRQYIDSAQRFAQAPRLTPAHIDALNLLEALSNDPALHFLMTRCSAATSSWSTTTPCCTTAPPSPTGPIPTAGATCCGCGWRRLTRAPCLVYLRSATAACSRVPAAVQRRPMAAAWCCWVDQSLPQKV